MGKKAVRNLENKFVGGTLMQRLMHEQGSRNRTRSAPREGITSRVSPGLRTSGLRPRPQRRRSREGRDGVTTPGVGGARYHSRETESVPLRLSTGQGRTLPASTPGGPDAGTPG